MARDASDQALLSDPEVLVTDWMLKDHIHGLHVAEALRVVNPALGVTRVLPKPWRIMDRLDAMTH